jgi:hypothetical protein
VSAEQAIYTLLAPVVPGGRVSADRIEQGTARPFAVFSRIATEPFIGLAGNVFDEKVTFELQCWGDTRSQAEALADACEAALRESTQFVIARASGYDGELDLEATILTVDWWAS